MYRVGEKNGKIFTHTRTGARARAGRRAGHERAHALTHTHATFADDGVSCGRRPGWGKGAEKTRARGQLCVAYVQYAYFEYIHIHMYVCSVVVGLARRRVCRHAHTYTRTRTHAHALANKLFSGAPPRYQPQNSARRRYQFFRKNINMPCRV
ncbi:unnamed protein product [Aphis gossypii]|uniref:Uncharacterized protein n=1 Tax=Aphis gossypii TaxID=80765 RepID=A0A9P0IJR8_APHGO|nr:unnamed protein product [Aphis gossypii]